MAGERGGLTSGWTTSFVARRRRRHCRLRRCSFARSTRTPPIAPRSARSSSSGRPGGAGSAPALMLAAEERARADGRWLLVLDTATGSAADALYRSLGWHETGVVPDYALIPDGRRGPPRSSGRTSGERRAATVLFAPDSFKGSLTSVEVARALADGWGGRDRTTSCCSRRSPTAARARSWRSRPPAAGTGKAAATDPIGRPVVRAGSGLPTAVGRSSSWPRRRGCRASTAEERDPVGATTFGTGEVLRAASVRVRGRARDRRKGDDRRRTGCSRRSAADARDR